MRNQLIVTTFLSMMFFMPSASFALDQTVQCSDLSLDSAANVEKTVSYSSEELLNREHDPFGFIDTWKEDLEQDKKYLDRCEAKAQDALDKELKKIESERLKCAESVRDRFNALLSRCARQAANGGNADPICLQLDLMRERAVADIRNCHDKAQGKANAARDKADEACKIDRDHLNRECKTFNDKLKAGAEEALKEQCGESFAGEIKAEADSILQELINSVQQSDPTAICSGDATATNAGLTAGPEESGGTQLVGYCSFPSAYKGTCSGIATTAGGCIAGCEPIDIGDFDLDSQLISDEPVGDTWGVQPLDLEEFDFPDL